MGRTPLLQSYFPYYTTSSIYVEAGYSSVPAKISKKGAAYHKPFPPSPQNRLPRRTANKSVRLRHHDFRSMPYARTSTAPSSVGAACRFFRGAFGRPLRTFL